MCRRHLANDNGRKLRRQAQRSPVALQQQPQAFPRIAPRASRTMSGVSAMAATGSAHATCQMVLRASPARAINDRYAHKADSAASALRAALPVSAESLRFSLASKGMIAAAATKIAIPK